MQAIGARATPTAIFTNHLKDIVYDKSPSNINDGIENEKTFWIWNFFKIHAVKPY